MRKCPDCADENINESLFCKHCGRCLLAPDPEKSQWSRATHTEQPQTQEGIVFYDGAIVKNSRVAWLMPRQQTSPALVAKWLFLLNFLALILMSQIASYIVSR